MNFKYYNPVRRRGAALLITVLVTTTVISVLFMASERTHGERAISQHNQDRQRATLAAESMLALIETKLVNRAAEAETLNTNIHEQPSLWWNLVGCSYSDGASVVIPDRGLWINGCLVRWRIEPVAVSSVISRDMNTSGTYSVNREIDQTQVDRRTADAQASNTGALLAGNPPYFHFRIVTEAYALKDPNDALAVPWVESGHHTVSIQAQRIVQLNQVNLFDYAVFYGAKGETGDIEFEPASDVTMNGSMHSNGSIYFGGAGNVYKTKKYKESASNGGKITLGDTSDNVRVSGVMGVFRMRKSTNLFFASSDGNDEPGLRSPLSVPLPGKKVKKSKHQSVMQGNFDVNGGDGNPANEKVSINGKKLTYFRDSRVDWSIPENRIDPNIRDAKSGGTVISTIANITNFANYPLEPQRLVGEQIPLYETVSGGRYTILPMRVPAKPLFYDSAGAVTNDPLTGKRPVYATDMPLFRFVDSDGNIYEDVWPNQPDNATSAALYPASTAPAMDAPASGSPTTAHTYLPVVGKPKTPGPVLGYYLEKSLFGDGSGKTGLTIRERGRQNSAFTWQQNSDSPTNWTGTVSAEIPQLADYADQASYIRAYVAWLKSNYVVYLGLDGSGFPLDITESFFDFGASAAQTAGDVNALIASQGRFVNRRESHWLKDHGYFTPAANVGTPLEDSAATYRVRPLTIHIEKLCAFLRTSNAMFAGNEPANTFNGLLYMQRTPRISEVIGAENSYDALAPLRYHPIANVAPKAPDEISSTVVPFLQVGSTDPDRTPAIGSPSSWVLYPLPLSVRVAQAQNINWGTDANGLPLGLTIVTPNQCYVLGSFNTTEDANGKRPSCAIFADSLTVLSNNWQDVVNDQDADYDGPLPKAKATEMYVSMVLNNLPTDDENVKDGGSGGVHQLLRYLENWNGTDSNVHGSLVVLNRMRYSRSVLGTDEFYRQPRGVIRPDSSIFTDAGKPPFSPYGIKVTSSVTTLADDLDY